jgi:glycosyltransferase involved in cell wall biosynthesis
MRVLIFCPDQHLTYDGRTPERDGIGGGVTARIRLAEALASLGHEALIQGACPVSRYRGVQYLSLQHTPPRQVDVLLVHSSGGALDVTEAASLPVNARRRFLFISGVSQPRGAELISWDALYAPSNFIAGLIRSGWSIGHLPIVVLPHGFVRRRRWFAPKRKPYRLIYTSHPSKGLNAAVSLVERLRERDKRFELVVCGGNALWGQSDDSIPAGSGVTYLGLLGQHQLWDEYLKSRFAIHLQNRAEPFGLSLVEAIAAGCKVVASAVGSFPELVRAGETGMLIDGDITCPDTIEAAAASIFEECTRPAQTSRVKNPGHPDWIAVARRAADCWRQ